MGSCKRYNYVSVRIVLLFKLMNRRLIGKSPKFEFGVCLFESNRFKLYITMLFYTPKGGYPTPHSIFIILYCMGGADGYPKKLLLLYIHSHISGMWKNVGKGKEVCNNLFNERILFNGKTVVF